MTRPEQFNRDYFENGVEAGVSCYKDYRWLPVLTVPMARAIVRHTGISTEDVVLDFGCAKGYLVKALRMLGYQAFGADVSEYAIAQADDFTRPFVQRIDPGQFVGFEQRVARDDWDWIIAKDVLEHLTEAEIRQTLRAFRWMGRNLFVVVPLGDGERFIIPEMEKDVTHKTRQTLEWWAKEINAAGFEQVAGSLAVPGIKENWTGPWPNGNGFFVAR